MLMLSRICDNIDEFSVIIEASGGAVVCLCDGVDKKMQYS